MSDHDEALATRMAAHAAWMEDSWARAQASHAAHLEREAADREREAARRAETGVVLPAVLESWAAQDGRRLLACRVYAAIGDRVPPESIAAVLDVVTRTIEGD